MYKIVTIFTLYAYDSLSMTLFKCIQQFNINLHLYLPFINEIASSYKLIELFSNKRGMNYKPLNTVFTDDVILCLSEIGVLLLISPKYGYFFHIKEVRL